MSTPAPDVDTIRLTGLSARGRHGVLPSERREGQLFVVDVTLGLGRRGTAVAAVTDSLNDAIDYGKVAASVIAVIEGDPVNLLETLAERVSDAVLAYGRVQEVEVCVHKPQAPLDVAFDDIMVTIHRSAEGDGLGPGGDTASDAALVGAPVERLAPAPAQSPPAPAQSPLPPAQPSPAPAAVEHAAPAESVSPGHAAEAAAAEALAPQWQGRQADSSRSEPEPWGGSADGGRQGWNDDQGQSDSWGGDADEIPSWGEPAAGAPAWGEPLAGTPAWGVPLGGTPAWGVPQAQPGSEPAGQEGPAPTPQTPSWGEPASGEPAWDQAAAGSAADPLAGAGDTPPQTQAVDPAAPLGGAPDAPAPLAGDTPWPAVSATPSAAADGQAPAAGGQPWGSAADIPPTTAVPGGGQWEGAPGAAPAAPVQEPPRDLLRERPAAPAAVVIALGGNAGGVVPALRTAVSTLRETAGIEVTAVAPLARTAAVVDPGADPQPDFLNTVVLITTTLSPYEVLEVCQGLEAAAGRVRTEPNGPRTLDADIIAYEGVTSADPGLTLPHPRAAQRAFVLVPWAEADPFAELANQSVSSLAEAAPDRDGVRWLALDWIDSDHLPTLPTGQYIAPPEAPSGAAADQPAPSGQSGQSGQSAWSGHSAQSAQSGQSAWSGQSAQSAAPAVDEDGEEDWSEPLNWNQVVGRRQNGQS